MSSRISHLLAIYLFVCTAAARAFAYAPVVIASVKSAALDGPAHHGIVVTTQGIADPNLSHYEVQVAPDTGLPAPPWMVYSTTIKPFDSALLSIPYRNNKTALKTSTKYCVRIRAIYAGAITPWTQSCGFTLNAGAVAAGDSDGDTISDAEEYALGLDPYNVDTDGDKMPDGNELANTTNPNKPLYGQLHIDTPSLDFGVGTPTGAAPNQHRVIVLTNIGDQPAVIASLTTSNTDFHLGKIPKIVSHIPPHNVARIPVSYIPTKRGPVSATATLKVTYQTGLVPITLTGAGAQIPDCVVSPSALDFGVVPANSLAVTTQSITVANQSPANDPHPNLTTPFGFTMHSGKLGIAPGLRGMILPRGKALEIPVLFQHLTPGNYDTTVRIVSFYCGEQIITVKASAE